MIGPFSRDACVAVQTDRTQARVVWKQAQDLAALAGRTVRLRFMLRDARLYAFWISPDEHGSSRGFTAAGGGRG